MQLSKQVQPIIYKQTLVLKMKPLLFQVPILRYLVAQKHQILSLRPLKQTPNLLLSICLMSKNNQQKDQEISSLKTAKEAKELQNQLVIHHLVNQINSLLLLGEIQVNKSYINKVFLQINQPLERIILQTYFKLITRSITIKIMLVRQLHQGIQPCKELIISSRLRQQTLILLLLEV